MKWAFLLLAAVLLISGCTTTGHMVYTEPMEDLDRPEPTPEPAAPKPVEKVTYSSLDSEPLPEPDPVPEEPVQDTPDEAEPEPSDPCEGIHCGTPTATCPDGYNATCHSYCEEGSCVSCAPDCSGHDVPAPPPEELPEEPEPPEDIEANAVFSKVFYDTPGKESEEEWLELYNPSDSNADISGWTISDNTASWTIPDGTSIPPGSSVIIARNATGFESLYGCLPYLEGFTRGLNNDGDFLSLKDSSGKDMDLVAWESFLEGWDLEAEEGTALVRMEGKHDTDPSNWLSSQEANPC